MFYAKLKSDGTLDRYPYTLTDLRLDTPGTSFPVDISDEDAASFGVVPVRSTDQPISSYLVNQERTAEKQSGEWVEVWIQAPATPEQIAERTEAQASSVRADRNRRLADCDWTQLPDAPVDHTSWATYRQELRDVTNQPGFPWEVVWPVQPQ
jgi:hypothetical protein